MVTALAAVLAAVLGAAVVSVTVSGPGVIGVVDAWLYVGVCALAAALLLARAVLVDTERGTWLCFALLMACNGLGTLLWSSSYSDQELTPPDAMWGVGASASFVGVALYLRHRVGDAYRAFWLDAIGITVCLTAVAMAVLMAPMRDSGMSTTGAALNLLFPCAAAAMGSVVLAAGSMAGRGLQRQDALLVGSFVLLWATDAFYALGLAGVVGRHDALDGIGWELSMALVAAAAWTRPSAAGAIRVGGWWEAAPTVAWMAAGGGVLGLAAFADVEPVAIALAALALVLAAARTVLVTRDVRQLVVHRRQALIDDLTGLPNRRALMHQLELMTRDRGRAGHRAGLLIADLDGFKEINDSLGHGAGDLLLTEVARRLETIPGAVAMRLGGDEFAAIVHESRDPRETARDLLSALAEPIALDQITVSVAASVGVARYPEDATTSGELVRRADVAMYDAKRRRVGVAAYAPERDGYTGGRAALAVDLHHALADPAAAGLWVAFQPQVRIATSQVEGVEALLRWTHPLHGTISPAELLPLAERTGGLGRLTDWVVDQAVAAAASWRAAGHDVRVSVNVSATTLIDAGLPGRVGAALARHRLPADRLIVEVTEDAVMSDPQRCCEVLAALSADGVGISVDDFGTGHSSLAQLRRIGAGELKIDRSFVLGMLEDRFDREVVVAVAGLGQRLGMRLVAEGVEDRRTWQALAAIGCDLAQGYGIARPMSATELLEHLGAARSAVGLLAA